MPEPLEFSGFALIFDVIENSMLVPRSLQFAIERQVPFIYYSNNIRLHRINGLHEHWCHPYINESFRRGNHNIGHVFQEIFRLLTLPDCAFNFTILSCRKLLNRIPYYKREARGVLSSHFLNHVLGTF